MKMMDKKNKADYEYVCATPLLVTKNGMIKFGESTIVRGERDLIVVKKQKRGNK
jgi:hypothetical protein